MSESNFHGFSIHELVNRYSIQSKTHINAAQIRFMLLLGARDVFSRKHFYVLRDDEDVFVFDQLQVAEALLRDLDPHRIAPLRDGFDLDQRSRRIDVLNTSAE